MIMPFVKSLCGGVLRAQWWSVVEGIFEIEIFYAIWYLLYKLRNVKNTHGGELVLFKLQTKSNPPP